MDSVKDYQIKGLKVFPFPIFPSQVSAWYRKKTDWDTFTENHKKLWCKNFGLTDKKPWKMKKPRVEYSLIEKGEGSWELFDLKTGQSIVSWVNSKPNLDSICIKFLLTDCIATEYGYDFLGVAMPEHNWQIFITDCIESGADEVKLKRFVKDFRNGLFPFIPLEYDVIKQFFLYEINAKSQGILK